jgi:drug/metabolite transporter (DMT)-like permease
MDRNPNVILRAYAVLLLMPLFFSSNLVIGRAAVAEVEPWSLAFWRWFLAFLILLPAAWPGMKAHRAILFAQWKTIAILGFLGMWVCGGGVYLSLNYTTATNGILIYTSSPVFILLLEIAFRGQRTSIRQVAGIVLAFVGVAAILLGGDLARLVTFEFNVGDIGIAIAAISWALYSVVLKRAALAGLPTIVLFATTALAGWIILFPMLVWEMVALRHVPASVEAWASIFGVAIVASVLAFSAYQYGIKVLGPTVTGIFLYLLPAYGVLMAVVFLGESLRAFHWAGFVLITLGLVLATAPSGLWQRFRPPA